MSGPKKSGRSLAHWAECTDQPWLDPLLAWEETERARHSLERRLRCAHIGRFKPLADFDWAWPVVEWREIILSEADRLLQLPSNIAFMARP